ncbi:MAG: aminotransferase class IV [Spirosomataceae bacterium]
MLFIETIRVFNRKVENIAYHNARLRRTRQAHGFDKSAWLLEDLIEIPEEIEAQQVYKCRVTYGEKMERVEFEPYQIRPIQRLQLVQSDAIEYAFKYANRLALAQLATHKQADEILIVKNGLVTDTSYTNLALYDGSHWVTPSKPLLQGTRRQQLLDAHFLQEADIRPADLADFQQIKLINAMMTWEESPSVFSVIDADGKTCW